MDRLLLYLIAVCWFLPCTTVIAQEATLAYHLKPGTSYFLDIDLQQNTRSEAMNSPEISLSSRTKIEFLVDSLDVQGLIYLTVQYNDLQLSMLAPGMNMDFNSKSGKNELLSDLVKLLTGNSFQMTMDMTGDIKHLEGLVPLFESLNAYPARDTNEYQVVLKTLEEAFGPDSFRSLMGLFISIYPVIQPMTSWTHDITYFFNTKPVQMVNRYNLTKSTREMHTIQGLGMLSTMKEFEEQTSMGEVRSAVSGSQTYDFQIDPGSGWLRRCVSRQRIMIETTIIRSSILPSGLKIPSYTETVFEVHGSKLE